MQITESIRIKSTADKIFNLYLDVESWAKWDPEVDFVHLPDGLKVGAKGSLKPRQGPKASIEITEVTIGKSFIVSSKLPFCQMLFAHDLSAENGETLVSHTITFSGPLSFLFEFLIGKSIRNSLPATLYSLKKSIEAE